MAIDLDDLHPVDDVTTDAQTDQTDVVDDGAQVDNTDNQDASGEPVNLEDLHQQDTTTDTTQSTNSEPSNLSGIEQYLAQFDIEGGMIDFKDGSRTHFNELPSDKQFEVLSKLHDVSAKSIEEKFGLDAEEINLINYVRQQDGSIDEIIDSLAQQRAQVYIAAQSLENANIEGMDADAVYTAFLMRSNPEATAEQIEHDLATAKKMSNYDKVVANIKDGMLKEHQAQIEQSKQASQNEMMQEIEGQRKEVVAAVSQMTDIDGLAINDGIKNDVLDLILNVDEDGDSLFMTQVFSDPKELFKAAFWYKNGADILRSREEYWKKEKSEAFKRGQTGTIGGKRSFTATDAQAGNQNQSQNRTTPGYDEDVSLDDIHNI